MSDEQKRYTKRWQEPKVHKKVHKKVAATVLNNVNDKFEKRFSHSNIVQCIDRGVGFFEAWVSVFDGVLNWASQKVAWASKGGSDGLE